MNVVSVPYLLSNFFSHFGLVLILQRFRSTSSSSFAISKANTRILIVAESVTSFYGTFVNISIDGLAPSIYNYTIIVWETNSNIAIDTVLVTVKEIGTPVIDHPDDIEYIRCTSGHSITWNPITIDPVSYQVLFNGTEHDSGPWDNSSITVSVDSLELGMHNVTLVV